jgi:endonuclease/exonuclease/phosphatase family metal-dependent hydrolase
VNFALVGLCPKPSEQGCNYQTAPPPLVTPLGTIAIERGFLAVDVKVDGLDYRVFNSHLEVQATETIPGEVQALQALQLVQTALGTTPADRRLVILGDMNSDPGDAPSSLPTPYQLYQAAGLYDAWVLRPGNASGSSCCQLEDLSNRVSLLNQRIDLILTREMPRKVKEVRLLGEVAADRTRPPGTGLWPSDHASVGGRLQY